MPDDSPDVPDDTAPEDTEVTCSGGITIPPLGVSDASTDDQE